MQVKTKRQSDIAETIQAARKSGGVDDPLEVILYDPLAVRLSRGFIRIGFSANAVTLLSLFFGICGSLFFYISNRWINLAGMALVIFSAILDCCDGQVARLTGTSSQLGRVLDGAADFLNYLAIYLVLGLRLMGEPIPFTETSWSFYIWPLLLLTMLCHAGQARMADYYKGLHLFFLKGEDKSSLARSQDLQAELDALPRKASAFERTYRQIYLNYTRQQEKATPKAQRLLKAMEASEADIRQGISKAYLLQSKDHIYLTNLLVYNIRTFALFAMLLLGTHAFYPLLVILLLEGVKLLMIRCYEAVADSVYTAFFPDSVKTDH